MRILRRREAAGRARVLHRVAFICAAAAMIGQLLGFAHIAFKTHVTCAEHGELVDADTAPEIAQSADRAVVSRLAPARANASHGHEHCATAPHRRDRAAHSFVRSVVTSARLAALERRVATVDPPPSIRLILLAPKSSPPA
jgi:hypothetical protein